MSRKVALIGALALCGILLLAAAPAAAALPNPEWVECVRDGGTLYVPELDCCPRGSHCFPRPADLLHKLE